MESLIIFTFLTILSTAENPPCTFSNFETLTSSNEEQQETKMYPNDAEHLFIRRTRSFQLSIETTCTLETLSFGLFELDSETRLAEWSTGGQDWQIQELSDSPRRENSTVFSLSYPQEGWLGCYRIGLWEKDALPLKVHYLSFRLYVLADPFSKHSAAYMSDEKRRQEFALTEIGLIWIGDVDSPYAIYWDYSPFSWSAILVANEILSNLSLHLRGDLVAVSRHFALSLASNNGTGGILFGKWGSEYPGKDINFPWEWSGSNAILEKYLRTKQPVRYGQCWTFAALLTTLSRAMGIPARSVTNFKSGSHVPPNGYVDEYFVVGADGHGLRTNSTGKAWNFHVWTELWLSRLDVKNNEPDYSPLAGTFGWQAIDSTFKLGPALVESIKNATYLPVDLPLPEPYDLWAMTQSVNATVRRWVKHKNETEFHLSGTFDNLIGRKVLTKYPLEKKVDDITNDYVDKKQNERWDKERAKELTIQAGFSWTIEFTNLTAVKTVPGETNEEEDNGVGVSVGNNITALFKFKLHTEPALTLHVTASGFFSDYTDTFVTSSTDRFYFDVELTELHKEEIKTVSIPPSDYTRLLKHGSHYFVLQGVATQASNQNISVPVERSVPIIFNAPTLNFLNSRRVFPTTTSMAFSLPQAHSTINKAQNLPRELTSSVISASLFNQDDLELGNHAGLLVNTEIAYRNSLPIPLTNLRFLADIRLPYDQNSCYFQGRGIIKTKEAKLSNLNPNQLSIAPLWIYLRLFNLSLPPADCAATNLTLQVALSLTSDQIFTSQIASVPLTIPPMTDTTYGLPFEAHAIKRIPTVGPAATILSIVVVGCLLAFFSLCSLYCSQRGYPPQAFDPYNYRLRRPYNHYTVYPSYRLSVQSPRPNGRSAAWKARCYYFSRSIYLFVMSLFMSLWNIIVWICWRLQGGLCYLRNILSPLFPGSCCESHPYTFIPSPDSHEV